MQKEGVKGGKRKEASSGHLEPEKTKGDVMSKTSQVMPFEMCWADFIDVSRGNEDILCRLIEFAQVGREGAMNYYRGERKPAGPYRVRCMHFLALLGYKVQELKNMHDAILLLSRCFGYGIIGKAEMEDEIEVLQWDSLLRIIQGSGGTGEDNCLVIGEVMRFHEEALNTRMRWWRDDRLSASVKGFFKDETLMSSLPTRDREVGKPGFTPHFKSLADRSRKPALGTGDDGLSNDDVLAMLGYLVRAAMPLAELVISDRFSDEDRSSLHRYAGKGNIFNLKNDLARLCSKQAHRSLGQ
jgi:hypothetical protein